MPDVTLIDPETGRILSTGNVPACDVHRQSTKHVPRGDGTYKAVPDNSVIVIDGSYDARTRYWRNNEFITRSKLSDVSELHLAVEEAFVIKRVPIGTEVSTIMGSEVQVFTVDDGKIEIVSRQPATFELIIKPPFPWQRQQISVTIA